LIDAIASRIPDVVVGAGDDQASMMGPLITAEHRDRVRSYVERAADEGAKVVVDGSGTERDSGFFVGCTLLDDVKPGMRVYDDEIFGPVIERGAGAESHRGPGAGERQPVRQRHGPVHA